MAIIKWIRESLFGMALQNWPRGITDATWCILRDFNAILTTGERIIGAVVLDTEVRDFAACIDTYHLSEMRYMGCYYSWTNKTIWSWLDRVLINHDWHGTFDYTQAEYKTNGLSNYTPVLISFSNSPRLRTEFQFYNMWCKDPFFLSIIHSS